MIRTIFPAAATITAVVLGTSLAYVTANMAVAAPAADSGAALLPPVKPKSSTCLVSGDGYLRAHLAGAVNANIDWPNSGTSCEGESRDKPPGVRLSFERAHGSVPNLLLVFGLTGVQAGKPAHEIGANVTVIVQGKSRIFGTQSDTRCTVDSLNQRQIPSEGENAYRVEARGFCTQPAHAIRGEGDVLVSTFEFAGLVHYSPAGVP